MTIQWMWCEISEKGDNYQSRNNVSRPEISSSSSSFFFWLVIIENDKGRENENKHQSFSWFEMDSTASYFLNKISTIIIQRLPAKWNEMKTTINQAHYSYEWKDEYGKSKEKIQQKKAQLKGMSPSHPYTFTAIIDNKFNFFFQINNFETRWSRIDSRIHIHITHN